MNNLRLLLPRLAALILLIGLVTGCIPRIPAPGAAQGTAQSVPNTAGTSADFSPAVTVSDQEYDGTTVVVASVTSAGPGWMVIHSQQNGTTGPAIGFTAVKDGQNKDVQVRIDPDQATPVLYAMLHIDAGEVGKYEFPGPDTPVFVTGEMVSPEFNATVQGDPQANVTPAVLVQNQQVEGGKVIIQQVVSSGPGWIDVHNQNAEGTPGVKIGYAAVKPGENNNITIIVDPSKVTKVLYITLHEDAGEVGVFDVPTVDVNVRVNGQIVGKAITSDGSVLAEQPVMEAHTDHAAAPGAGTGTAAPSAAGTPTGAPVGAASTTSAPVAGANPTATTDPMSLMVMDTPRPGIQPQVKAVDQTLIDGNKVKIDLVTSSGPGWLVIYTLNDAGQPVQPIGQAPIKDGENRDVTVQVDPSRATGTLYAQLHVDHGQVGTYEFPGPDAPLMLGVAMIASQFDVQAAEGAGPTSLVPAVTVADQPIKNSSVVIPEVISDGDGWIVVHRQNGDLTIGSGVGNAPVHSGVNTNVVVEVDTTRTSGTMYAMLHKDLGQKGVIEFPGADEPVLLNGQIVAPTFKVTLTSDSDVIINVGQDVNSTQYLVDGRNMTLYFSINDPRGKSNCTGECLETWRPLFATGQIITGPGVDKNKVNVIIRENGTRQVTYAGAPLYYYTKDIDPGDIRGQGFDGAWFTLTP